MNFVDIVAVGLGVGIGLLIAQVFMFLVTEIQIRLDERRWRKQGRA